ncbi:MAG: radical SAM protein [Acidobacteria bacterium]|jgi:anaerobic ribonucleoside-triphosphate reductase activating protein|nr:radical SAM protein [Acidobacteriota bacterium]
MPEITFIVDELQDAILVEDNQDYRLDATHHLRSVLGEGQEIGCARPLEIIKPPIASPEETAERTSVRIAGYYHNSLTEGPGRRSSVLFQFCPLKCKGCYVPQLHDKKSGTSVSVKRLAELLLDSEYKRDGVTILGGEPFAQTDGLFALVKELRKQGCPHIVCYSGYTLKALIEKSAKQPLISAVLNEIDILIDGAYIESLAGGAGLWTGSGNQRVIDLAATKQQNQIVLYS